MVKITKTINVWIIITIAFLYNILCVLQHCHTPSDFPATKDASFHVKSIIKVTICKLQSRVYIVVSLIVRKYIESTTVLCDTCT